MTKTKLLAIGSELVANINYLQKTKELSTTEANMIANAYLLATYSDSDGKVKEFQDIAQIVFCDKSSKTACKTNTLIKELQ